MKLGIYSPLASIGLCLWIGACEKDTAVGTTHTTSGEVPAASGEAPAPDNTKVNERDNPGGVSGDPMSARTPLDQGNSAADLAMTQQIRQALVGDDSLSNDAKNVKIITANGLISVRGPVKSEAERASIEATLARLAGPNRVDDQIDVESK